MPACVALSGLLSMNNQTQGGAWRLTPPRLPWADMSRPFGADMSRPFGAEKSPIFLSRSSRLIRGYQTWRNWWGCARFRELDPPYW
jgi:hypothetical protein